MSSDPLSAWRGDFGDEYTRRNANFTSRVDLWKQILQTTEPESILEVGAGSGANLHALKDLTPARLAAVEPCALARKKIEADVGCLVMDGVAQSIPAPDRCYDLVFTSGVLIHIPPDALGRVCDEIHRVSKRYVACIEYFSDEPETKPYQGQDGLLFKRDFGGFYLDRFPDLQVIGYGFAWKRMTGLDNVTWTLLTKR